MVRLAAEGLRKDGRVALARGGGPAGPGEPSDRLARRTYAALALVPCLPASIDVCLAVWEQFWCDRAGLFCGSLAFEPRPSSALLGAGHREGRRMRIRRDIPTGTGVEARESFPGPVLRRRRCFGRAHHMSPSAGAVSPGEEWSRPKLGRRPARVGVGEFTVPPELADTQPHPKSALAQARAASGLARW